MKVPVKYTALLMITGKCGQQKDSSFKDKTIAQTRGSNVKGRLPYFARSFTNKNVLVKTSLYNKLPSHWQRNPSLFKLFYCVVY